MDSFNKSIGLAVDKFTVINKNQDLFQKNGTKILKTSKEHNENIDKTNKHLKQTNKIKEGILKGYEETVKSADELVTKTGIWNKLLRSTRNLVIRLIAPVLSIFSVATIVDAVKAVIRYHGEMKTLSFRMGHANTATKAYTDTLYDVSKAIGQNLENTSMLLKALIRYRVHISDLKELAINAGYFAEITGVASDKAARLTGELMRVGKLGKRATIDVLETMVSVQRAVGLTESEMEGLSDSIIYTTKAAHQFGKSDVFIKDLSKGVVRLAGAFSKVGIEAKRATDFVEDLLDPSKIEDNMLLYSQLGISVQDALDANFNPDAFIPQFQELGARVKDMGFAGVMFAKELGVPYRDLMAMAEMTSDVTEETTESLADAVKKQQDGARKFQVIMNYIRTTIGEVLSHVVPIIERLATWIQSVFQQINFEGLKEKLNKVLSNIDFNKILSKFNLGEIKDKVTGFIENININEIIGNIVTTFKNIFNFVSKMLDPKIWIVGGIALIGLFIVMRKKLFAMAVGFGDEVKDSTRKGGENLRQGAADAGKQLREDIDRLPDNMFDKSLGNLREGLGRVPEEATTGLYKNIERIKSNMHTMAEETKDAMERTGKTITEKMHRVGFRERRAQDVRQRIIESEAYRQMQELANTFDARAETNLLPWAKSLTENTANYVREISMGVKPLSYMSTLTEQNNKRIEESIGFRNQERMIMEERYEQEKFDIRSGRKISIDALDDRIAKLNKIGDLNNEQSWELRELEKRRLSALKEESKINEKGFKEKQRFYKFQERQIARLSQEQLKAAAKEALESREQFESEKSAARIRITQIEEQRTAQGILDEDARKKLGRINEILENTGELTVAQREEREYLNKKLKESEDIMTGFENDQQESLNTIENIPRAQKEVEKNFEAITKAAGMTVEEASKIDSAMLKSTPKRFREHLGSIGRDIASRFENVGDKFKKSITATAEVVRTRLNPKNIFKGIGAGFRKRREEKVSRLAQENIKGRKGLIGTIGKLTKGLAIFGGIGVVIASAFGKLEPLQKAADFIGRIAGMLVGMLEPALSKLVDVLLPIVIKVIRPLIPLFATLINILLPPLLLVLGLAVSIIGKLVEGVAFLVEEMFILPHRFMNMWKEFRGKEVDETVSQYRDRQRRDNAIWKGFINPIRNIGKNLFEAGGDLVATGFRMMNEPPIDPEALQDMQNKLGKSLKQGDEIIAANKENAAGISSTVMDAAECTEGTLNIDEFGKATYIANKKVQEEQGDLLSGGIPLNDDGIVTALNENTDATNGLKEGQREFMGLWGGKYKIPEPPPEPKIRPDLFEGPYKVDQTHGPLQSLEDYYPSADKAINFTDEVIKLRQEAAKVLDTYNKTLMGRSARGDLIGNTDFDNSGIDKSVIGRSQENARRREIGEPLLQGNIDFDNSGIEKSLTGKTRDDVKSLGETFKDFGNFFRRIFSKKTELPEDVKKSIEETGMYRPEWHKKLFSIFNKKTEEEKASLEEQAKARLEVGKTEGIYLSDMLGGISNLFKGYKERIADARAKIDEGEIEVVEASLIPNLDGLFGWIKNTRESGWEDAGKSEKSFWKKILETGENVWSKFKKDSTNASWAFEDAGLYAWEQAGKETKDVLDNIETEGVSWIGRVLSIFPTWDEITDALNIKSLWGAIEDLFNNIFSKQTFENIGTWIVDKWGNIVSTVKNLFSFDTLEAIGVWIGEKWSSITTSIKNLFSYETLENIGTWIGEKWSEITTFVKDLFSFEIELPSFDEIGTWISNIFDNIKTSLQDWWNEGGLFSNLPEINLPSFSEIGASIQNWWNNGGFFPNLPEIKLPSFSEIWSLIQNWWNKNIIPHLPEINLPSFNEIWSSIQNWWDKNVNPFLPEINIPSFTEIGMYIQDWWSKNIDPHLPEINLPSFNEIWSSIQNWWNENIAPNLPSINIPSFSEIGITIQNWWSENIIPILPEIKLPSFSKIWSSIQNWWNENILPNLPELNIPSFSEIWSSIQNWWDKNVTPILPKINLPSFSEIGSLIQDWWSENITPNLPKITFPSFAGIGASIQNWWNNSKIIPNLPKIKLPSFSDIGASIQNWWSERKILPTLPEVKLPEIDISSFDEIRGNIQNWWNENIAPNLPSINIPSFSDIGASIQNWWDKNITPILPEISLPSFSEIGTSIQNWWSDNIKPNLPEISFPSFSEIGTSIQNWWSDNIKPNLPEISLPSFSEIGTSIQNWWSENVTPRLPEISFPSFSEIGTSIQNWWNNSKIILNLSEINIPSFSDIGASIQNWWSENIVPIFPEISFPSFSDIGVSIQKWWNKGGLLPILTDINIPSFSEIGTSIQNWWSDNIIPNLPSISIPSFSEIGTTIKDFWNDKIGTAIQNIQLPSFGEIGEWIKGLFSRRNRDEKPSESPTPTVDTSIVDDAVKNAIPESVGNIDFSTVLANAMKTINNKLLTASEIIPEIILPDVDLDVLKTKADGIVGKINGWFGNVFPESLDLPEQGGFVAKLKNFFGLPEGEAVTIEPVAVTGETPVVEVTTYNSDMILELREIASKVGETLAQLTGIKDNTKMTVEKTEEVKIATDDLTLTTVEVAKATRGFKVNEFLQAAGGLIGRIFGGGRGVEE